MPLANRLNDSFKDLIRYVAHTSPEGFVFLPRGFMLNSPDGLNHLVINAEEYLKDILRCIGVFKQVWLLGQDIQITTNHSAHP
jgi:hypothetical protein